MTHIRGKDERVVRRLVQQYGVTNVAAEAHEQAGKRVLHNPRTRDLGAYASYFALDTYLGKREERSIAHNTRAARVGSGRIGIIFHATRIVTFDVNGNVELNSGGYSTTTTKQRINQFITPHGWRLYSKKYKWIVEGHGKKLDFYDGITVPLGSTVLPSSLAYQGPMRSNPRRPRRTKKRMRLMKEMKFFQAHAGGIVGRNAEVALVLARAEKYARDHDWDYEYYPEEERYEDVYGEKPPEGAEFVTVVLKDKKGKHLASLGFVDWRDSQYLRIVRAELAAEAMPTQRKNPVKRGGKGKFVHIRVESPKKFVRRSLRTVKTDGGRVIVGHKKGEKRRTKTGRVRQSVQAILRPKGRKRTMKGKNPPLAILGNPPDAPAGTYLGRVSYIEYRHAFDGEPYYHDFRPAAYMVLKKDGSIVLYHPKQELWKMFEVKS